MEDTHSRQWIFIKLGVMLFGSIVFIMTWGLSAHIDSRFDRIDDRVGLISNKICELRGEISKHREGINSFIKKSDDQSLSSHVRGPD